MTVKTFTLPDLGEGLTEAELVTWLVRVGDAVAVDQPIAEVETAKSAVEVPCPFAGTVHQLHGDSGQTLDVGAPLISVDTGDRAGIPAPEGGGPKGGQSYREEERAGADPAAAAGASDDDAGSGSVLIGYGTPAGGSAGRRRRPKRAGSADGQATATASAQTAAQTAAQAAAAHDAMASAPRLAPTVVSPIVRKLAKDRGIDISTVRGSGPGGLILRRDVVAAADAPAQPAAAPGETAAPSSRALAPEPPATVPSAAAPSPATPSVADARTGLGVAERIPVSGIRKAIGQAMTRSRSEIPEATVWVDVDATELVELRARLKAQDPERAPGLMALVARFVLAGLARHPELASRIETREDGTQQIVRFDGVNLGFAAQTDRGLVVPNIRNAHTLSARGLDAELRRLTELARSGKAGPAELSGSTFTLNNYGVFGTDGAAAIINHPEVAILGIGRIIDRPWVVDGQLAVRKVTQLSLAFDHRVCDGGAAGGFLRMVADAVEDPRSVLADL